VSSRHNISSGARWEETIGYSRAVVVGDACYVSGTTDAGPDGRAWHPDDAGGQARAILDIVAAALEQGGFSMEDVVRTRMYVTRAEDVGPVSAVHGEVLGRVRPASTLVRVAGLIEPSLLVEIEVDARRGAG